MLCTSTKKVVGGKSVKVDLEVVNGLIVNAVVSGDFFLYPEEAIHEIESSIRGRTLEEAIREVSRFRSSVEFLGVTIDDVVHTIKEAYRRCTEGVP